MLIPLFVSTKYDSTNSPIVNGCSKRKFPACLPNVIIIHGARNFICSTRCEIHAPFCFLVGSALSIGLHFNVFRIVYSPLDILNTCSMACISNVPLCPQNGSPFMSSILPGASPKKIILGYFDPRIPGTYSRLVLYSSHEVHDLIFLFMSDQIIVTFLQIYSFMITDSLSKQCF